MLDGKWNLQIQFFAKRCDISVVIEKGRITGDDGSHSYDGLIRETDQGRTDIEFHVRRHVPGEGPSFNNLDEYRLSISGIIVENTFTGKGGIKGAQGKPYKIEGIKTD